LFFVWFVFWVGFSPWFGALSMLSIMTFDVVEGEDSGWFFTVASSLLGCGAVAVLKLLLTLIVLAQQLLSGWLCGSSRRRVVFCPDYYLVAWRRKVVKINFGRRRRQIPCIFFFLCLGWDGLGIAFCFMCCQLGCRTVNNDFLVGCGCVRGCINESDWVPEVCSINHKSWLCLEFD